MSDKFVEHASGVQHCYRTRGDRDAEPLLRVAGLGQDLTVWPEEFRRVLERRMSKRG